MQNKFLSWRINTSMQATAPLSLLQISKMARELQAGKSVLVDGTVLKVTADSVYVSSKNPLGAYVCAQTHMGEVVAVIDDCSPTALQAAVDWAQKQMTEDERVKAKSRNAFWPLSNLSRLKRIIPVASAA